MNLKLSLISRLSNNRGSIIPYVLVISPAILFIIYQLGSQFSIATKEQMRVRTITSVTMIQSNLIAYLKDPTAWSKTIADAANGNMACLKNHTNCVAADEGSFQVDNGVGTSVYSSVSASSGFNTGGGTCASYGSVSPGNQCSIRVNLTWKADCILPCTPTRVQVVGEFAVTALSSQVQLNLKPYKFDFFLTVP